MGISPERERVCSYETSRKLEIVEQHPSSEGYDRTGPMKWVVRVFTTVVISLVLCLWLIGSFQSENSEMTFTVTETADYFRSSILEEDEGSVQLNYHRTQTVLKGSSKSMSRPHLSMLRVDPKQDRVHHDETSDAYVEDEPSGENKRVLLITYFRGGSTFLGEVFNRNRETFYWFEPLAAPIAEYKTSRKTKDYLIDQEENAMARPKRLVGKLLNTTRDILNCDIHEVDDAVLKHYFAVNWKKSSKFKRYQSCVSRHRDVEQVSDEVVEFCRSYLIKPCMSSNLRVIKAIRLFVAETIPLLRLDPSLRLVYYTRDPRGTLLSRFSLARKPLSTIPLSKVDQLAALLCAKLRTDLEVAMKLQQLLPDRIVLLRYEDLASEPVRTLKQLYRFLQIELPPPIVAWIMQATHARRSDSSLGTNRANATAVATRWRHELPVTHQAIIGQHCNDVIERMYSMPFGYNDNH